jgi:hypothetical protein
MSVIGILRPNAVLTILDLRSNVIEDGQLPEFADVLVANTTLKKLAFSLTGIADPEAVTAFWRRLSQRPQGLLVQLKYTELRGQKDRSISDTQIANWKKLQDAVARGGSGRAAPSVVSEFGDWAILQPPVPQFDNASVLEQKRARFDVSVLWADLNMVDPE